MYTYKREFYQIQNMQYFSGGSMSGSDPSIISHYYVNNVFVKLQGGQIFDFLSDLLKNFLIFLLKKLHVSMSIFITLKNYFKFRHFCFNEQITLRWGLINIEQRVRYLNLTHSIAEVVELFVPSSTSYCYSFFPANPVNYNLNKMSYSI